MNRRLAAIMFADVVGYSRMMEANEAHTLSSLKSHREIVVEPSLATHGGRLVKVMGDGMLAEFPSAVSAVSCALEIQTEMARLNAGAEEAARIVFRIGVHVGDVMIEDHDIYGDGVNVAARLEALAEPGGICISQQAYDQVATKLDLDVEDLGENSVKNIARPIRAYGLKRQGSPTPSQTRASPVGKRRPSFWAAGVLFIVLLGSLLAWSTPWQLQTEPALEGQMAFPLPKVPSIAVLPFNNLTGDDTQDVMVDGLVEEVIASLVKIPRIFVIDGNSTFTYKDKSVTANQVAEDLGVRYVMEGSVRSSGDSLRITANLIDALEGYQIWAEIYDRQPDDILALQSEIAERIFTELNVELVSGELARLQQNTTNSSEAYAMFLQAQAAPRSTKEDVLTRIKLYEKSLELDPEFSAALAAMAVDYARMGRTGMEDRDVVYPRAEDLARQAIAANESYSGAYLALSTVYRFRGEFEESLALVEKALSISPNDADAIMYKGRMLRLLPGHADEAVATIKSAMRRNPYYPPDYLAQLSWAYFAAGQFEEAHQTGLQYAELRPNHDHAHWRLAMTYSVLGMQEEAETEMARTLQLNPKRTIANTLAFSPYAESNLPLIDAEIDAMRNAGFPEE